MLHAEHERILLTLNCSEIFVPHVTVVIDAYPNTATVEQGTTLVLVCRVVGVPSTTVLSYQWTCPGGCCDAGAVDREWAARIQQGNILVVNARNGNDNGAYTCTVLEERDNTQQVGMASYTLRLASELYINTTYCNYIPKSCTNWSLCCK